MANGSKPAETRKRSFLATLLINLVIVGYIALREYRADAHGVERIPLSGIRPGYLLLGIGCFFVALAMDRLKYRKMLMTAEGRDAPRDALRCAVLGKYYDNVTPFGAGGQPFQIHFLRRQGYSAATSAALPVTGFLTQQLAFCLIAAGVFIFNSKVIDELPVIRVSAYVGFLMYLLLPAGILLFAAAPKTFFRLLRGLSHLLHRLHLLRDPKRLSERLASSMGEYVSGFRLLNRRPHLFARLLADSVIYQTAILSIPFFMLRAFGGTGGWWTVFSLVVYVYAAITVIPTPGNAGAAEGSFYAVFSALEGGYLFWAMIGWRILVYYSWLAAGLIVLARRATARSHSAKQSPPREGPLRAAMFIDAYYPRVDGVVRTVDAYQKNIRAAGGECFVICPRGPEKKAQPEDPAVIRTPALRIPGFAFLVPLPLLRPRDGRRLSEAGLHVIHAHSPFLMGQLAVRLGRKLRLPVVATFHSKYYDDALRLTHSRFLANVVKNIVVEFFCRADAVWACSSSTAQTLRDYGFRGEIAVMENGSEPFPPGDRDAMRTHVEETFSIPGDRPVVLFVGQQIWHKNLRLVLDTAKLLQARRPQPLFLIAGTGYDAQAIQDYARELALEDTVRFLGQITDKALLAGLYLRAQVFFFPSVYDNAPLVLREAAQAATPALLAENSNAAEGVRDGVNGYLAPCDAEAMARRLDAILSDRQREKVGEAASATIPVSWETIVARAEAAYRAL